MHGFIVQPNPFSFPFLTPPPLIHIHTRTHAQLDICLNPIQLMSRRWNHTHTSRHTFHRKDKLVLCLLYALFIYFFQRHWVRLWDQMTCSTSPCYQRQIMQRILSCVVSSTQKLSLSLFFLLSPRILWRLPVSKPMACSNGGLGGLT